MRDDVAVRRLRDLALVRARHLGEQARLEPPAVLVRTLEVDVGERLVGAALVAHALLAQERPRAARVEPDVHRVGAGAPLGAPLGGGALALLGQDELGGVAGPPVVGPAVRLEDAHDVVDVGRREERHLPGGGAGCRRVDDRDRHAPGSLPADAPLAAAVDVHLEGARAARGEEVDAREGVDRARLDRVEVGEPLGRRAARRGRSTSVADVESRRMQ